MTPRSSFIDLLTVTWQPVAATLFRCHSMPPAVQHAAALMYELQRKLFSITAPTQPDPPHPRPPPPLSLSAQLIHLPLGGEGRLIALSLRRVPAIPACFLKPQESPCCAAAGRLLLEQAECLALHTEF